MPPQETPQRPATGRIIFAALFLCALCGVGYLIWSSQHQGPKAPPPGEAVSSVPEAPKTATDGAQQAADTPAESKPIDQGTAAGLGAVTKKGSDPDKWGCKEISKRMRSFFTHLDGQPYIQEYKLGLPSQQHLLELTERLMRLPPVVAEEHTDILAVLKNRSHMFRTMGLMNISLIKDILQNEQDRIEDIAALLYRWTEVTGCSGTDPLPPAPALEQLYEYSAFFLNTLGGQSYLSRRDPRLRMLLALYAVRYVDRANSAGNNRYGIDIRPVLERLTDEVQSSSLLRDKERLLDVLLALQEKYQ